MFLKVISFRHALKYPHQKQMNNKQFTPIYMYMESPFLTPLGFLFFCVLLINKKNLRSL